MVDKQSFLRHSRRTILLVAVLIVILVSSIYAYYWSSTTPHSGPSVSITSPPLELSLQLEKTTFSRGENVSVIIGLRNISNHSVAVTWASWSPYFAPEPNHLSFGYLVSSASPGQIILFDFIVSDENDTSVFELAPLRYEDIVSQTLAPQEFVNQTFVWNMRSSLKPPYDFIPAGTYYVKASTPLMSAEDWNPTKLETSSITLEIT